AARAGALHKKIARDPGREIARGPAPRFALRLAFRLLRLRGAALDVDLLRLHLGQLRNRQRQHALAQVGLHVVGVDALGQRERPREAAVRALVGVERLVLLTLLLLALAAHRQAV